MWEKLIIYAEQMQNMERAVGQGRLPERVGLRKMTSQSCRGGLGWRTRLRRRLPDLEPLTGKAALHDKEDFIKI